VEICEAGAVLDVMVDTPVAPQILRGARRSGRGRPHTAIAWGRLPAGETDITVTFTRGRLRSRARAADGKPGAAGLQPGPPGLQPGAAGFACLTTWCWIAVASGSYCCAVVTFPGGQERLGLRRNLPW
jgi:hypothetical protein